MTRRSDAWQPLLRTYTESDALAGVTSAAEALYTRLLAWTGDDGLAPAHPGEVLFGPLAARARRGQLTPEQVAMLLDELEGADLIRRYTGDGRPMLAVLRLSRYVRKGRFRASSFPPPPWPVIAEADAAAGGLVTVNAAAPQRRQDGATLAPGWQPAGDDADPEGTAPTGCHNGASLVPTGRQPGADRAATEESTAHDARRADLELRRQCGAIVAPGRGQPGATLEPRGGVSAFQHSSSPAEQQNPPTPQRPAAAPGAKVDPEGKPGTSTTEAAELDTPERAWRDLRLELSEARSEQRPVRLTDLDTAAVFEQLFDRKARRILDVDTRGVPVLFAQFRDAWLRRRRASRRSRVVRARAPQVPGAADRAEVS